MFRRYSTNPDVQIELTINDLDVLAREGDSVAAVVLAQGLTHSRTTPVSGAPRAPYCLMGVCYDCLMVIDGVPNQRACMTQVKPGMKIQTQNGEGNLDE